MKSLFFSIFAILIIASCESSTSPDTKPEGQRIGTWMVYDTEAEWVGSQSQFKAKGFATQAAGDTTFIDSPDGESISVWKKGNIQPTFSYVDSAGTEYPDSTYYTISFSDSSLIDQQNWFLKEEDFEGYPFKVELPIGLDCAHIPDTIPESRFYVTIFSYVGQNPVAIDTQSVKEIDIKGFVPVVENMSCTD